VTGKVGCFLKEGALPVKGPRVQREKRDRGQRADLLEDDGGELLSQCKSNTRWNTLPPVMSTWDILMRNRHADRLIISVSAAIDLHIMSISSGHSWLTAPHKQTKDNNGLTHTHTRQPLTFAQHPQRTGKAQMSPALRGAP